jgi:hypothetical protein
MDNLYRQEKQAIEARYMRTKHWFEGELQTSYRKQNPEWDGYVFWRDCYDAEIRLLDAKYEKQFCLKTGKKVEDRHMWIGINPDIKKHPNLVSLYKIFTKSRVLRKYKYNAVVESHTDGGYRPHIHMIIYTQERPNRIIQKLARAFECNENFVDCKTSYELEAHKQYINGLKRESKQIHVENDRFERDQNGIPHTIVNDPN